MQLCAARKAWLWKHFDAEDVDAPNLRFWLDGAEGRGMGRDHHGSFGRGKGIARERVVWHSGEVGY